MKRVCLQNDDALHAESQQVYKSTLIFNIVSTLTVCGTHTVSPPVPVISTPARGRGREEVSEDEGSLVPADHQPPVEVGPASHHPRTAVR